MDNPVETNTTYTDPLVTPPVTPNVAIKKSKLPLMLVILGSFQLILPLFFIIQLLPHISGLVANLFDNPYGFLFLMPMNIVIAIFIAEIFYGINLMRRQKVQNGLFPLQKKWALVFLIFGIIAMVGAIPMVLYSLVTSIYAILGTIK